MPDDKLPIPEFAKRIKQKYPQYNGIADTLLVQKIVDKYPEYKESIDFGIPQQEPSQQYQQPSYFNLPIDRPEDLLHQKVNSAAKTLDEELYGNDDVIAKDIKQMKLNNVLRDETDQYLMKNRIDAPHDITIPKEFLPKERRQPEVSPDELKEAKSIISQNESLIRKHLDMVAKSKPEKKQKIEAAMYVFDSKGDLGKEGKIAENARKIQIGALNYDIKHGILIKPEGFLKSIATSWKHKDKLLEDADTFTDMSDEELANELDNRRASIDKHDPISVPEGNVAKIGEMIGGQPASALVAGAVTTMGGAPEAAPFVGAYVGGGQFGKMTYAAQTPDNYYRLLDMGIPRLEAAKRARTLARNQGISDALSGAAMSYVGVKMGTLPKVNLSGGFGQGLQELAKKSGVALTEAGVVGGLQGASQAAKNILSTQAGIKKETGEGVFESTVSGGGFVLLMKLGTGALAKGSEAVGLSKKSFNSIKDGLSKIKDDESESLLKELIDEGRITEDEAAKVRVDLTEERKLNESIDASYKNVTDDARAGIKEKIERRVILDQRLKIADDAAKDGIKEKITKVNEDINELAKDKVKTSDISEDAKVVNKAIDNGDVQGMYAISAKSNPEQLIKEAADQALNRIAPEYYTDEQAMTQAKELYGEDIVAHAIKKYPTKQKITVSTPNIVNVKLKENAISERSPEAVPLGETPVDSGKMGEGIPPSEELTATQEIGKTEGEKVTPIKIGKYKSTEIGGIEILSNEKGNLKVKFEDGSEGEFAESDFRQFIAAEGDYSIKSLSKEILDQTKKEFIPASDVEVQRMLDARKNPKQILNIIQETTTDPNLKTIAGIISKNIHKAPFLKLNFDLAKDRYGYSQSGDIVASYGGGIITINPRVFKKRGNNFHTRGLDAGYATVLHEFLHAFTIDAYRKPKTAAEREFRNYIDKTYKELKSKSLFKSAEYGFSKPTEFISEIMVNPEFRRTAAIYKPGIWEKMVEFFAKFFGYSIDKDKATDLRYEKVKEAFNYIANKIPNIRAGKGQEIYYSKLGEKPIRLDGETSAEYTKRLIEWSKNKSETPIEPPSSEDEGTGITHEATAETRKAFGLPEYEKQYKSDVELNAAADEAIKSGYNMEGLVKKMEAGFPNTDLENTILKKYKPILEEKLKTDPSDENLDFLHRIVKASDLTGSIQARGFRARQGTEFADESLSGFFTRDRETNLDAPLTEQQKATVQKEFDAISKAKDELAAKNAKLEEELTKAKAEKNFQNIKSTKPKIKRTHEDYVKERQSLVEKLKQQRDEHIESMRNQGIQQMGGTGGIVLTAKMAKTIGEIVKSFADEGITKLGEVVSKVHDQVKDIFEGITEKDIHNVIAGVYNEKGKTKSELAIRMRDLGDEAKLINQYQALIRGEEPKTEKAKVKRNQEIEALREKIKAFRKDEVEANTFFGEEKSKTQKKLDAIVKKNEAEVKKIQEDIAAGKFEKEKKISFFDSPEIKEIKKTNPDLYKRVIESKDKLIKVRLDREDRLERQEFENRTKLQKAKDLGQEALDAVRVMQTNPDLSFTGRQGLIYFVTHPIEGSKVFWNSVLNAKDPKRYDRYMNALHESSAWPLIEKSGVSVIDPKSLHASKRSEGWRSKLIERVPILGPIAKASGRAFATGENMARVNLFLEGVKVLREKGKSFESYPKEYTDWGSATNNMTGRGGLGKLEPVANTLAVPFWSPRLMASRINLFLNPAYYIKMSPTARMMLLKNMGQYIFTTVGLLAAAKAAGVDVETDPRSSDFGKVRIGNTRYDFTGGAAQYIRIIAQFFGSQRKSTKGKHKVIDLDAKDALQVPVNLVRSKLSPVWGFALDAKLGENFVGEPVEWTDAYKLMIPMLKNDIKDAAKDGGADAAAVAGMASFLGIGVQTYDPNKKKPKQHQK